MKYPALALLALFAAALPGCAPRLWAGSASMAAAATFGARLGESSNLGGRTITPLAIVEDSRCPNGAQCIQAGTVRLQIRVQGGAQAKVATVGLRAPADIGEAWLHLVGVCPYPQLSRAIAPADYRLTLVISNSAALPTAPIACPPW